MIALVTPGSVHPFWGPTCCAKSGDREHRLFFGARRSHPSFAHGHPPSRSAPPSDLEDCWGREVGSKLESLFDWDAAHGLVQPNFSACLAAAQWPPRPTFAVGVRSLTVELHNWRPECAAARVAAREPRVGCKALGMRPRCLRSRRAPPAPHGAAGAG